jgi:hypothetical protein
MIKVNVSMTAFIDPDDIPSFYLDEVSLREYVEESLTEGINSLFPREVLFNYIDIEGLS